MKFARKLLATAAALFFATPAFAQQLPSNYMGRFSFVSQENCVIPTVTAGSAYGAGNVVGGLLTFPSAVLSAQTANLQSVRLSMKSVQTAEFDVTFLSGLPVTTFTDKTAPALAVGDFAIVQPTIKLTIPFSGLGTHTVYGADNINRGIKAAQSSFYAVITTPGTPTFVSASDIQLCASWRLD
jgi:hypothetical protein